MFAQSAALTEAYLDLKYGTPTKDACRSFMKQAAAVIEGCKNEKSEIIGARYKSRQDVSRLDMLDIWQSKAEAAFDNASDMMFKALV